MLPKLFKMAKEKDKQGYRFLLNQFFIVKVELLFGKTY